MLLLEDRTRKVALSTETEIKRVVLVRPKASSPPQPASADKWAVVVDYSGGSETFNYPSEAEAQATFDKAAGKSASSYARQGKS